MTFFPFGDSALLLNFEQKISADINAEVVALATAIEKAHLPEVTFITPAYCSLTVGYDPFKTDFDIFSKKINALSASLTDHLPEGENRHLEIPVSYAEPHCPDMAEVEKQTGLSATEIVELHTSVEYRVFMMGFVPGFVYLGSLPAPLYCARKTKPRLRVPEQSVGLAGSQTGIYPSSAPGGWQIIGRTSIKIFDETKEQPFFFKTGDAVRFVAV